MKGFSSFDKYQRLTINGKKYTGKDELYGLCAALVSEDDFEKQCISSFIKEWLNDSPCIIVQTSGSTGKPKAIEVKKSAMVASARRTIQFLGLKDNDKALLCLSANYIAGKMMLVRAMVGNFDLRLAGVSSNPLNDFSVRVDFAAMVPMQVSAILNDNAQALNTIKHLIIGGGSLDPSMQEQLAKLDVKVWETYGMTETVSHVAMRPVSNMLLPFKLMKGIKVSTDERDCLMIHPSDINSEILITNDIVRMNSQNEFFLLGRFDNIINTGGVKVLAETIESKLQASIKESFAISWKYDEVLGQKVVVVVEKDSTLLLKTIDLSVLSKFEKPKELICIEAIPKTETGKIKRKKLQQLLDKLC